MAKNNYDHQITITCNATAPQEALKLLNKRQKEITKDMSLLNQAVAADKKQWDSLNEELKAVQMAIDRNKKSMEQYRNVITNLSNATGRQLRQALRQLKKDMATTTDSAALKKMQQDYNAINRQIKILEGSLKNIEGEMGNLKGKTTSWLQSAIQQQRQYVASMDNVDAGYQKQLMILRQLEAEETRRAAATVSSGTANASQLAMARQALLAQRSALPQGAAGSVEAQRIEQINALLKQCDAQIAAIEGKAQQLPLTTQQVEQKLALLTKDLKTATPEQLRRGLQACREQLDKIAVGSPKRKQWVDWAKQLETALKGVDKEAGLTEKRFQEIVGSTRGLRGANMKELQQAAARLNTEMQTLNRRSKEYTDKQKQLQAIRNEINKTTGAVQKQGGAFQTTLRNLTAYFGLFQLFSKISQMLTDIFKKNLQMSDQLSQIRMVSGLAMKDVEALSDALKGIDTRSSLTELQQIAYEGSKLGFGQYGVEGLKQFTEAANQLNVALKEQLGEDTLPIVSKLVENMGLIKKMGIEKAMLATGSAMFRLSASSTSSAGNIVEFSKRLAGLASTSHITTDELLALGSASDSMMLMPEVASTAFNKFITSLQAQPRTLAKALQIPSKTITDLLEAGKTMDAIVLVFERMHKMGNMNALYPLFKPMGSEGSRLNNVMVAMAKNVDMLKTHLQTSNAAFKEATDVTQEYNLRQESAQGWLERANNLWAKSFINKDGVDMMKSLTREWYNMSKALTTNVGYMTSLNVLIKSIVGSLKILIDILPELMLFVGSAGIVRGIMGVVSVGRNLFSLLGSLTISLNAFKTAWAGMTVAMRANVIGLGITLLITLVSQLRRLRKSSDEAATSVQTLDQSIEAMLTRVSAAKAEAEGYYRAIMKAKQGTEERNAAIRQFNKIYGTYMTNLLDEKSTAQDIAKAYREVCTALQRKIALEAQDQELEKTVKPRLMWSAGKLQTLDNAVKGTKYAPYGGEVAKSIVDEAALAGRSIRQALDSLYRKMGLNLTAGQKELVYNTRGANDTQLANYIEWENVSGKTKQQHTDWMFGTRGENGKFSGPSAEMRVARAAAAYVAQEFVTVQKQQEITNKYKPYIPPEPEDSAGKFDNDKTEDKLADQQRKKEEAARKRQLRADLKDEEAKAKAIMDNVKNYYERQITAITEMATESGMPEDLQKKMVDAMTLRMNAALAAVRKVIGSGTKEYQQDWKDFRQTLINDMYEPLGDDGTNESTDLLDKIVKNNIDKLRQQIMTLSKALNQNGSVLADQIMRKATENEQSNAKITNDAMRKRREYLLERDYTGKVNTDYENQMETLEVSPLTSNQMAGIRKMSLAGDEDGIKKVLDERSREWQVAFQNARENIVALLNTTYTTIDADGNRILDRNGQDRLMTLLFGEDYKRQAHELQGLLDGDLSQWDTFYNKLIDYTNAYTDAQKKAHDTQKKELDFLWTKDPTNVVLQEQQNDLGVRQQGVGQYARKFQQQEEQGVEQPRYDTYGNAAFMQSFGYDPEVESYHLKMEAAAAYYDFLKAHGADAETLREQEQNVLQSEIEYAKSVASQMKQRMEDIYGLMSPVEEFGTAMGKAFATMTEDAEAGRAAVKAAVGDMINGFLEQTVKMTEEFIKRRIMQQVNDRLTSTEMHDAAQEQVAIEEKKQDDISDAQKGGNKTKKNLLKSGWKAITSIFKKQKKEEVQNAEQTQDQVTDVEEQGGEARQVLNESVGEGIAKVNAQVGQEVLAQKQTQTQADVQTESAKTQADTTMGIAQGASKIIGSLGWWGIPLVAVITALLNGLLSFAMSKVSSLFGGGKSSSDTSTNTKLVSGMLTYDSGNVQSFADGTASGNVGSVANGSRYAANSKNGGNAPRPVIANDGKVYMAREDDNLGTGLVTEPTTTFINARRAIVGENGPELVVGRETTRAIQMYQPGLMRALVSFDKNYSGRGYRAYDEGNVQDFADGTGGTDMSAINERLDRMDETNRLMAAVLDKIATKGITAIVQKYGRNGLVTQAADGAEFMRRNSGDRLWQKKG